MVCSGIETSRECMENFCQICGGKTITHCPSCQSPIRGYYHVEGVISFSETPVRSYCHHCGNPYPWAEEKIQSLKELIEFDEKSTTQQKEVAISAIPDILVETPKTQVSAIEMKRFLASAGNLTRDAVTNLLVAISCEAAKGAIFH